jgi:hypothetical protein
VTPDPTDLLLEQLVPESALEFAGALTRSRDIHRVLSAAEDNVRPERGDARRVERGFGGVLLHLLQGLDVP